MSNVRRLGFRLAAAFAGIALWCPLLRASGEVVLASADFESDLPGAMARPLGPPTVSEEVYDVSTTTGGVAVVEASGSGRRFLLGDVGTVNQVRGIRMPFSAIVSSGTLNVTADVCAAEQATGGILSLDDPQEGKWFLHLAFGGDGKFRVHDQATAHSYAVGTTYRVTATLTLGTSSTTVDYHVQNLSVPTDSFSVEDCISNGAPSIGALRYATDGPANGSFSIDNVVVSIP